MKDADLSIYLVTDASQCERQGRTVAETVAAAVAGGVTAVQIREKTSTARDFLATVRAVSEVVPAHVAVLVNDRIDVYLTARDAGLRVDGVHVGQSDLPVEAVRQLIGPGPILGLSASSPEQLTAAAASSAQVDYVGVGALHATATKRDAPPPLGHDRFAALVTHSALPVVAIGGLTHVDLPRLRTSGAAGAAVVSAVCGSDSPREAAERLAQAWATGN
jgi:thiamine-phosphate diphosphorylase